MFALADRGWTSVPLIWNSIWIRNRKPGGKSSTGFLVPAACLILLGAVQQPLYRILVGVTTVSVATCRDIPSWYRFDQCNSTEGQLFEAIGRDIEPAQMAIAEQLFVRTRMAVDLASVSVDETQPYLWPTNTTYKPWSNRFGPFDFGTKSLRYWIFKRNAITALGSDLTDRVPDFFVAGLPVGTTTGVLRQHIMRLNSSISCKEIDVGDIPSPCPGDQPFTVLWDRFLDTEVRICVPGNSIASPWSPRRSRQELIEEMYLDFKDRNIGWKENQVWSEDPPFNASYTIRCTATTTRGYFELGNDWNNNTYGPLLEQWPNPAEMAEDFNDWTDTPGWNGVEPYIPSDVYAIWREIQLSTDI
jgi:hypothetical protein